MTTKQVVIPGDPDDLICDTCPNRFPWRGDTLRTFEWARMKGWHIYQKVTVVHVRSTGEEDVKLDQRFLCPECIGTPRTRVPAPPVLEGQDDIFGALGIEPATVEKETRPKKGREGS